MVDHNLCFDLFSLIKIISIYKNGIFGQNLPTNLKTAKQHCFFAAPLFVLAEGFDRFSFVLSTKWLYAF